MQNREFIKAEKVVMMKANTSGRVPDGRVRLSNAVINMLIACPSQNAAQDSRGLS